MNERQVAALSHSLEIEAVIKIFIPALVTIIDEGWQKFKEISRVTNLKSSELFRFSMCKHSLSPLSLNLNRWWSLRNGKST